MRECFGDIWQNHKAGAWICVTTNGIVKADGKAVMGAGIAKDAARRFPDLPAQLAAYLQKFGNRVFMFPKLRIITFPTKHHFHDRSDINLIIKSCRELVEILDKYPDLVSNVWLPRPGCKNGRLRWDDVREAIEPLLDDRVIVIEREEMKEDSYDHTD